MILSACSSVATSPPIKITNDLQKECVVLIHGLWRSAWAMRSIAQDLLDAGYETVSTSYPSTSSDIPSLATKYVGDAVTECQTRDAERIHLVGHSMGGILIRQYLQDHLLPENSKVVMLSPPNQGSELSERFGNSWWYRLVVGPAGSSLTKGPKGIIDSLEPIAPPLGIIGAYRSWSLWPNTWLPSPNDGTVSVESMKLPEMDDFILIENGHAMMRYDDQVRKQIRYFIEHGRFQHNRS